MPNQHLRVSYDSDVHILNIISGERGITSTSLEGDFDVIADLTSEEAPSKVVALEILDPVNYFPLGTSGYDAGADTLLFGSKDGATVAETNGYLVAYWKPDPDDPNDYIPLGVEVLSARKWLSDALNPRHGVLERS